MIRKPTTARAPGALYARQREQAERDRLERIGERADALERLIAPGGLSLWVRLACVCTAALCAELRGLRH